jgi:hypothetical protein
MTDDAVLEALCARERQLEVEAASLAARLDEIRDLLAHVRGPRRGRPRKPQQWVTHPLPTVAPEPEPDAAA